MGASFDTSLIVLLSTPIDKQQPADTAVLLPRCTAVRQGSFNQHCLNASSTGCVHQTEVAYWQPMLVLANVPIMDASPPGTASCSLHMPQ